MKKQLIVFLLIVIALAIAAGLSTKSRRDLSGTTTLVAVGENDSLFKIPPDSVAEYVATNQRFLDSIAAAEQRTNDRFFVTIPSKNMFDKNSMIIPGYYVTVLSGALQPHATSAVTTLIACEPNTQYVFSGDLNNMSNITKRYYDAGQNYLSFDNTPSSIKYWTTPADCYYFQMTIAVADSTPDYNTTQIELGGTATAYTMYGDNYIMKPNISPQYLEDVKITNQADNDSAVVSRKYVQNNFSAKSSNLTVITNGDTIITRTAWDETYDLIQQTSLPNTQIWGDNRPFNFVYAYLIPSANGNSSKADLFQGVYKQIANNSDDVAPRQYNGTYVGANHGLFGGIAIRSTGHGKTVLDVGSRWAASDSTKYYIVNVINADSLWVVSQNNGTKGKWSFDYHTIPGTHLYHYSKATETTAIALTAQTINKQVEPVIRYTTKKAYLNGVELTDRNWSVYEGKELKIVEDYVIANPEASLDSLYAKAGSVTLNFFNLGEPDIRILNTYTYDEYGGCVMNQSTFNYYDINETGLAFIQAGPPSIYHYDSMYVSVPRTLPITIGARTWDLRKREVLNVAPTATLNITSTYFETAEQPPYRMLHYLGDTISDIVAVFQIMYDNQVGNGQDSVRVFQTNNLWQIATTRKAYPKCRDSKLSTRPAGTFDTVVTYRGFYPPNRYSDNSAGVQFFKVGQGKYKLMLDYYKTIAFDKIILPDELTGYYIAVADEHANFTMHSKYIDPNGIFVSVENDYGWGVYDLYQRKP
jgi:hypothetical protein